MFGYKGHHEKEQMKDLYLIVMYIVFVFLSVSCLMPAEGAEVTGARLHSGLSFYNNRKIYSERFVTVSRPNNRVIHSQGGRSSDTGWRAGGGEVTEKIVICEVDQKSVRICITFSRLINQ